MTPHLPETYWEFWVVDMRNGKKVAVHHRPDDAQTSRDILNEHERQNGREPVFSVVPYSFSRS